MTTHAASAATARTTLVARRHQLDRSQKNNENDGALLRGEPTERASSEKIAHVLVSLSERERTEVDAIDAALARLDAGTWGVCVSCEKKISAKRLGAMPEATRCLECASAADQARS